MVYQLLFLFVLVVGVLGDDYVNTPINSSSGLYYEGIGEAYVSNNNWEFVTYIDYGDYLIFYQYIHQQAEKLREFCNTFNMKISNSTECDKKYSSLRSTLNDIDETDENMAHYLGIQPVRRVKRFWNEIGQFFSKIGRGFVGAVESLFGVNNPDLAAYEAEIRALENNQRQMANAMTIFTADAEKKSFQIDWLNETQKQIQQRMLSLENDFKVDSAEKEKQIKELQRLLEETRIQQQEQQKIQNKLVNEVDGIQDKIFIVDQTLETLNQSINENKDRLNKTELNIKLLSLSYDLNFILERFQRRQQSLYDAIIKAKSTKKGALDPSILSPTSLIKMLQDVVPKLKDEKFPFYPNIDNAYRLYNLIEPNVFISNNKLLFIFKVPLVKYKAFNIFKISSLPVPIAQKTFAFILPKEPFLLVDKDETEYMLLPQSDFEHCDRFGNTTYICIQKQYTSVVHTSKACEIQLYTAPHILPKSCDTRIMVLEEPVFIQLLTKNTWIYLAPNINTRLTIRCHFGKGTILVEGSGIINFNKNCSILFNKEELKPILEYTRPVIGNFIPEVNLLNSIETSDIQNLEIDSLKYYMRISPFDLKKLEEMSISISQQIKYNANLFYLLLIPVVLLLIVTVYFHYKMKMDYKKYKDYISRRVSRLSTIGRSNKDDRLKMRVKLNNKNEKICKMSMYENASTNDPDAEYLTVRFKVQKEQKEEDPYLVPREFSSDYDNSTKFGGMKKACNNMFNSFMDKTKDKLGKTPFPTQQIGKESSEILYNNEEVIQDTLVYSNLEHKLEIANQVQDNIYDNVPTEQRHISECSDGFDSNAIYDNVPPGNYLDSLRKQKPRMLKEHIENLRLVKPRQGFQ